MPTSGEAISGMAGEIAEGYSGEANLERLADTAPGKLISGGVDTFQAGFQIGADLVNGDLGALTADATNAFTTAASFVDEAAGTIGGIVSDPLGWLISNGVSFLISWIEPLNEMLELVTGDPDALQAGADAVNQLGAEIEKLRMDTEQLLADGLADWEGAAAATAGKRLAEFRDGISGTAGATGEIATLLAVSSAVMSVAKDLITSIISDFVEWLIVTWLAALAASTVTFGGSVATASGVTAVRAGTETAKASRWVQRVKSIIDKLNELIGKIKNFIAKIPGKLVDGTLTENLGGDLAHAVAKGGKSAGEAIGDRAGEQLKESTVDALKDAAGNARETLEDLTDAAERRDVNGDPDMDDAEVSRKLDF